jgi:23S rRNA (guanosine2251-2'-O)-methyltransferase
MKAVDDLHMNGIQVFASEMTAEQKLEKIDLSIPCCIIMGNEENGVYPALLKICDSSFQIPMYNKFESLNVSVASGVILYEIAKQRGV